MNKLFTKIAKLSLGLAMAAGVGVAVGSNKKADSVHASPETGFTAATMTAGTNGSSCTVNTYSGIKVGTSSKGGDMSVTVPSGATKLVVYAAAWKGVTGLSLNITKTSGAASATISPTSIALTADAGISNSTPFTLSGTESSFRFELTLANITANTVFKFASSTTKRFVLWSAQTQAASKTLSSITLGGTYDTEFTVGDTFNHTGMTVTANYSDSTTATVTSSATWSSPDMSTSGTKQVTVSYTESSTTKTATYNITVNPAGTTYTVTNSVSNATLSSSASVAENDPLNITIIPGSHWVLPTSLTSVTMGGNTLTAGSGYTYNSSTGAFSIASVTGNVVITGACTAEPSYSVTYVAGDHGSGSNYVVSNQYAGSYTLATFATAGFTAASGYAFKKWSVGGVEYAEGASITISGATTVTAVYEEVTTYTIVTSVANLVEDTTFVLVYETSGSYYVDTAITSNHVALTAKTAATTISNGVSSGSTLVSSEAMVLTLKGSEGAWKIKCGDQYLKFTGSSNGNDAFDTEANASTFSASIKDNKYILFTCTSSTGSGRVWRMNTSSKDMRNYATSSGVGDVYMFAYIPPQNELSSIALSGDYKTSFNSGETFSFGGTVTASYTIDSPKGVTGSTTFHLDSSTGTNMSGVTMTHAAHDGHTIYAKYTEGGITKTATYSVSVANAPVSSLTIASNTGKVSTKATFDMSEIGVTILPADAVQTYEWTVLSNTVNNDYIFEGDIVTTKDTAGSITLKCTSTDDSSKYQTFVLTVSGNPVVTLPNSVTLYTGKTTTVTASVEGGTSPYTYSWSITSGGSNASISSGGSTATVTLSGTAAGSVTLQCSVTDSNSKSDSASVTFSVTASAVTSVNWSASAFDVFSGATIPSNIDDTWEVNYEKNNGDADNLVFGDYELYLGSKEITSLPYTFVAEDDGEELHVEYGGISSSPVAVAVTQRINDVMASSTSSWDYTFPSKQWSEAGSVTLDGKSWTMSGTDDGSPYFGWDNTKGQQFGSGTHPFSAVSLQSSGFSGTVDSVTVYTSGANSINATVQVSVGGTAYGSAQTITNANAPYTFDLGGKSGTISIDWVNSSSKAIYIHEIVVNTVSGSSNIANSDDHKAAQRVAVKFAKAFNAAMDTTSNCTANMSSAWSSCSSAYDTFKSEAAALGSGEEAYAKNLIKYATAQYSDDSGEACIERMMKTYEICVQKHGQTKFMSDLVTVGAPQVSPLVNITGENTNTVAIIVIISMVSVTAIGGYFFLRKRKEN